MSCTKKCYETRAIAKAAMKEVNRKKKLQFKLTYVYYCIACSNWHTTHQAKSKRRTYKTNKK
jgi:heme oxygenase